MLHMHTNRFVLNRMYKSAEVPTDLKVSITITVIQQRQDDGLINDYQRGSTISVIVPNY